MSSLLVRITLCALLLLFAVTPVVAQEPSTMVLVGKIVNISGENVTLAALSNPQVTQTIVLEKDTKLVDRKKQVAPRGILTPGSVLIVQQVRVGNRYKTVGIQHLPATDVAPLRQTR